MTPLSQNHGWLGSPTGVLWPAKEPETISEQQNPFIKFRSFLWSHKNAVEKGFTDRDFIQLVNRLDNSIGEVDGTGFSQTPFENCSDLSSAVGRTGDLWIKNETENVSGSHKARHLFGLALHLEVDEVPLTTPLSIASCGNAALGAAVVARAVNRPLIVHVPVWAETSILDHLADLDADIRICERKENEEGDPCVLRSQEAVAEGAISFGCQGTENVFTIDGGRTLGFELVDAWISTQKIPEHLFIQVGGGALASSVIQALYTALNLDVLEQLPVLHSVQSEGCSPLSRAFDIVSSSVDPLESLDGDEPMWAWENPASVAIGILDDVVYDWKPIVWALLEMGSRPMSVNEETLLKAHKLVHGHTSISPCITGTSGIAGILASHQEGTLNPDSTVAALVTGIER